MKYLSPTENIFFSIAWAIGFVLSNLLMIYQLNASGRLLVENMSVQWMAQGIALIAIVQGLILGVRSWKLSVLWISVNIILGWVGFAFGYVCFFLILIFGGAIPPFLSFLSFAVSGSVLGLIQWGILRRFPRAYLMILATSLTWLILWGTLTMMFAAHSLAALHTDSVDPEYTYSNIEFIQKAVKSTMFAGFAQGIGIFYALRERPKTLLTKRLKP
jgi:hypothetical protein